MKSKDAVSKNPYIQNKRARFEYQILQEYTAGLVLQGTEIKSIRLGKVSLTEGYCYFSKGELWVKQIHIAPYEQGNIYNHDEVRPRKLLLKKQELNKLLKTKEKGFTIIPLALFITPRGYAKLQIGLAKGKKLYDKRQTIKERDVKREMQRNIKV